MLEVKGGKVKCGPERRYKDCSQWRRKDITLEKASGRGTPAPQRTTIKLSRAQPSERTGAFPSFYRCRSSCTPLKLDYKVSSPWSHKLREIQLEADLHLATKQQASEMQTAQFTTNVRGKEFSLQSTDFFTINFTPYFLPK